MEGRRQWKAWLGWDDSCSEVERTVKENDRGQMRFIELDEKVFLIEVVCSARMFDGYSMFFLWDETVTPPRTVQVGFPVAGFDQGQQKYRLVYLPRKRMASHPRFDKSRRELRFLDRYRAFSDCGEQSTYRWVGSEPKLMSVKISKCAPPDQKKRVQWQQVFSAAESP